MALISLRSGPVRKDGIGEGKEGDWGGEGKGDWGGERGRRGGEGSKP